MRTKLDVVVDIRGRPIRITLGRGYRIMFSSLDLMTAGQVSDDTGAVGFFEDFPAAGWMLSDRV